MAPAVKQAPFIVLVLYPLKLFRACPKLLFQDMPYQSRFLFESLSRLFDASLVQSCSIAAGVGHVLLVGRGEVVGTAEVGLGAHI